jgi:hypothetical protein
MEAASTSERSVNYQTTRRNNPEQSSLKSVHLQEGKMAAGGLDLQNGRGPQSANSWGVHGLSVTGDGNWPLGPHRQRY